MTRAGRRTDTANVAGRGHLRVRNGREYPRGYAPKVAPVRLDAGTSGTLWSANFNVTEGTQSITDPDGISRTRVNMTGTGDNLTSIWDWIPGGTFTVPAWAQSFEFDLYIEPSTFAVKASNGFDFLIQIRNAAGTSVLQAIPQYLTLGWNHVRIPKAAFTALAGSPVWGDSTAHEWIRFRVNGTASFTPTFVLGEMGWGGLGRSKICVAFDDIGESVATVAFPIMDARGIPGSNAMISDALGQDAYSGYNRCTAAELLAMNRRGWDVTNHTKSHQSGVLPTALQSACATEIETCRDAIISNGLGNGISEHIFCAPYGEYGTNYWAAAAAAGCKVFRLTQYTGARTLSQLGDTWLTPLKNVGCVPVINTTSTSDILAMVDSVAAAGGSLILLFHHIVTTPGTSIEYSTANFTTIMDGLVAASRRNNFDLVNMTDMYLSSSL